MRGGQWQALYLIERLTDAVLLARTGSPLFEEAARRKLDVRALTFRALTAAAKQADLVHVHDARSHTLAAIGCTSVARATPLVVSRRVAFPVKRGFFSVWKYEQAALYIAVSKYVAARLMDAGIRDAKVRVVHDGVPIPEPACPRAGRVVALASKPLEIPGISVDLTTDLLWRDLLTRQRVRL